MKNILITGSNGFIGKYLQKYMQIDGFNILFGTTSTPCSDSRCCIVFSNLYSDIEKKLESVDIDIIIHLAAIIPKTFDHANKDLFLDNSKMMINLYEYSISNKISKFIYLSGFGSMENLKKYDIKDFYTLSKVTGEHICSMLESKGIEATSLRVSSPFGEFNKLNSVLPMFTESALRNKPLKVYGNGNRHQNFIFVGDILKCIYIIINQHISGAFDLVSSKNVSMLDLAKIIIKLCGSESSIILGSENDPLEDVKLPDFNIRKLEKILGHGQVISFENGLTNYVEHRKTTLR